MDRIAAATALEAQLVLPVSLHRARGEGTILIPIITLGIKTFLSYPKVLLIVKGNKSTFFKYIYDLSLISLFLLLFSLGLYPRCSSALQVVQLP